MLNRIKVLLQRIRGLFSRRWLDEEFQQELDSHLEMLTEENLRRGLPPEKARRTARVQLGGITQLRETNREIWGFPWIESLLQDLRYGLRQLRRNPGFSAAVIGVASLGIAATCIVFSFADAAVFRALPYKNVSRLVAVEMTDLENNPGWSGVPVPVFLNWREHAKGDVQLGASHSILGKTLVGGEEPAVVFDYAISQGLLDLLGVRPILGRGFLPSDYTGSGPRAIILSYDLWQHLFDGQAVAVGRTVTLDGVGYTIVGIMPPGSPLPGVSNWASVCWTPLTFNAEDKTNIHKLSLAVWGRLDSSASPGQAQAALGALARQVISATGEQKTSNWRVDVTPLRQRVINRWRSILLVLLGAVGLLLAISCANIAGLLLARAHGRNKEIAVRAAIGASRFRVVRQLLTESLILSCLGGALGILLARWGILLERHLLPERLRATTFAGIGLDSRVLAATLAASVLVGIAFGFIPAIYASRVDLVGTLTGQVGRSASRRRRWSTQSVLVVAELALSLTLLTGAGLMLRSFLKLEGVHPGLDPHQVLTTRVFLPQYLYHKPEDQVAAYQNLLRKVKTLPGVQGASLVAPLPLAGVNASLGMPAQPGMANVHHNEELGVGFHAVSPGYFGVMGIPLLQGRVFTDQDIRDSEKVAIVDKTFADRFWPGEDPVGKLLYPAYPKTAPVVTVVGEVGSVRDLSLAADPRPQIYNPFTQYFLAAFAGTLVVKTPTPAVSAVEVQKAVHSLEPQAPVSRVETMRQVLGQSLAQQRLYLALVGVFAALALLLAAAGIASIVSYTAARRKREIGIRMALGAEKGDVLKMVVGQGLRLALIGVAVGVAGALALTRFLSSMLYGVKPTDPFTFIAVSLILIVVALVACYIPARRATKVEPMVALRYE
jgi:putative ABC transport system permease protein